MSDYPHILDTCAAQRRHWLRPQGMALVMLMLFALSLVLGFSVSPLAADTPVNSRQSAQRADVESLERIRDAALGFARVHLGMQSADTSTRDRHGRRLQLAVTGLDERLRLAACDGPLQSSAGSTAARGGRLTVLVRCGGSQSWKVYVRLSVQEYREIVVASRALGRGEMLGEADITLAEREVSRLHIAYSARPESLVGRTLRRNVRAGEPIALDALDQRLLVENGEQVTLVSGAQSYSISMAGVALNDAAEGARVNVRNLSSGRVVEGRAIARGKVQVGPAWEH